jgi:ATP-dependent protease Clp ATPase subunit
VFVRVDLKMYNKDKVQCSFCPKLGEEVDFLIEGPKAEVHICAKCVDLCTELAEDERKELKDGE